MASSNRIPVVPDVLRWARESAGFTEGEAAQRLHVAEDRLREWESGIVAPTIVQLRSAAQLYKRPLAVLLLPSPPRDFMPMRDFRRLHAERFARWSPALTAEFRRAVSQREVVLEVLELAPDAVSTLGEQLQIDQTMAADAAGATIRSALAVETPRRGWSTPYDALNFWIGAAEANGILVLHTRGVDVAEMRGFSISERPSPLVALNGSDSPRARLFTLAHELAHLALNDGGLCDLHEVRRHQGAEDDLESYCNAVAASILMNRDSVLADPTVAQAARTYEWSLPELAQFSARYGTSSESFLLRLISLGRATWNLYWKRKPELEVEYQEARRREREAQREGSGGPSFYTVKARDLGHGYVSSVLEAFRSRVLSSSETAEYLDIRFEQIPRLEAALR
jgi:Zn-dependent peptidase ImmA (M78 family)/transcriptional regulator with XRE-family HTH domain